jgi:hypothetical protein
MRVRRGRREDDGLSTTRISWHAIEGLRLRLISLLSVRARIKLFGDLVQRHIVGRKRSRDDLLATRLRPNYPRDIGTHCPTT